MAKKKVDTGFKSTGAFKTSTAFQGSGKIPGQGVTGQTKAGVGGTVTTKDLPPTQQAGVTKPSGTVKNTAQNTANPPNDFNPVAPPAVFRNQNTGRVSGVTVGGKTFLDLSPAEVNSIMAKEQAKIALPQGAVEQSQQSQATQMIEPAKAGEIPSQPLQQTGLTGLIGDQILGATSQIAVTQTLKRIVAGNMSLQEAAVLGLTPLDLQVLSSGQAEINNFAQILEGVPIIGKLRIRTGAGFSLGVADMIGKSPSKKVDELLIHIKKIAAVAADNVALAQLNPSALEQYRQQVRDIEKQILTLESRIKLISIQSPAIQADPDNIISITSEIQSSINSLSDSKLKLGIQ